MNKWKEIWEKRIANDNALLGNKEEVLLELKRINGFDSTDNILSYDAFYDQYIQTKRELSFGAKKDFILQSIFEVVVVVVLIFTCSSRMELKWG